MNSKKTEFSGTDTILDSDESEAMNVLSLKCRVLSHFWVVEMRVVSGRKLNLIGNWYFGCKMQKNS